MALIYAATASADPRAVDDLGRTVTLKYPARRIVSLAPHTTELLFDAGAGQYVVGTVAYSDFPPAAQMIPQVGNSERLDLERIVSLRPDLLVVWLHANQRRQLEPLLKLGIPVFYDQPHTLEDIAHSIVAFGKLAGTEVVAKTAANRFRSTEEALRRRYAKRPVVRVFYEVWEQPLMTLNGDAVISDIIRLCGGRNIFGNYEPLVPIVSSEAVIKENPEAIVAPRTKAVRRRALTRWKRWPELQAVARGNLFLIPDDLVSRPSERILQGARLLCEDLALARSRRPK